MKSLLIEQLLEEIYLCEGSVWRPRDLRRLSEASQKEITDKTVTSLFKDIKAKAFNLDFSDVEHAKGDITKITNYNEVKNAINYLKKLSMNESNKEIMNAITQLDMAHTNLLSHRQSFMMGFKTKNNLIIYMFNSVSVALVQATSFLITQTVEVVKDNMNTYHCELRANNLPKNANLSALTKFNDMSKSGKLKSAMSNTLKLKEDVFTIGLGVMGGILLALYIIREIIFAYYFCRIKISNYLSHLKEFVEMNASTLSTDQKSIREKQLKVAERLGKLSDMIAVDQQMATDRSESSINTSNKNTANTNTPNNTGDLSGILY